MRDSCLSGIIVIVALFAAPIHGPNVAHSEENTTAYKPDELVAAVSDRLSSIDSLSCECQVQNEKDGHVVKKVLYAREGTKWHYSEVAVDEKSPFRQRAYCCDNELVFEYLVGRDSSGADKWLNVQLTEAYPMEIGIVPDQLLGQRVATVDLSLVEIFATAKELAVRPAPGSPACVSLIATSIRARKGGLKYDVSVTVDTAHEYLPREILVTEPKDKITWPGWEARWVVSKFDQVIDEQTGKKRWFPMEGEFRQGKTGAPTFRLTANKVRLNPRLPANIFHPDIPDGVTIFDQTAHGKGRGTIKGGVVAANSRAEQLARNSLFALDSTHWNVYVFVNIAVIAALLCAIIWRRRFFRSSKSTGEIG